MRYRKCQLDFSTVCRFTFPLWPILESPLRSHDLEIKSQENECLLKTSAFSSAIVTYLDMTAHEVPNSHHVSFLPCSQWVLKELTWSVLTEKFYNLKINFLKMILLI